MFIFALKVCVFLSVNTWQAKLLEQAHLGLLLYQSVLASLQSLHRVHRIIKVGKNPKDHKVQPSIHLQHAYSTKRCRTGVASNWNLCHRRRSLSSQSLVSVSSVGGCLANTCMFCGKHEANRHSWIYSRHKTLSNLPHAHSVECMTSISNLPSPTEAVVISWWSVESTFIHIWRTLTFNINNLFLPSTSLHVPVWLFGKSFRFLLV